MTTFLRATAAITVLTSSVLVARPALAQELQLPVAIQTQAQLALPVQNLALVRPDLKAADQTGISSVSPLPKIVEHRPTSGAWKGVLAGLDAMTVGSQMADFDSTMKVLKVGGVETNPLMAGLVNNRNAFLGVKLGIAAGLVYATHNLSHNHKIAAVVASVAANSAYAFIAQRNYTAVRNANATR